MRCISRSTILLVSWQIAAWAAPGTANECVEAPGARILAGQLAARIPAFGALAADADLAPAPIGSMVRVFTKPQLEQLLIRTKVDPAAMELPDRLCVVRRRVAIPADLWQSTVESAIRATCGETPFRATVREFPRQAFPEGELQFSPTGLGPASSALSRIGGGKQLRIWRGRLVLPERASIPVWIQLELEMLRETFVAERQLAAGSALQAGDYRMAQVWRTETAGGRLCGEDSPREPESGMILRSGVAAGEPIPVASLRRAPAVRRGATVELEVTTGQTVLRAPATAERDAEVGEQVRVKNHWNGRGQTGTVAGNGRVRLE